MYFLLPTNITVIFNVLVSFGLMFWFLHIKLKMLCWWHKAHMHTLLSVWKLEYLLETCGPPAIAAVSLISISAYIDIIEKVFQ